MKTMPYLYNKTNTTFYTGTAEQPDTIIVVAKPKGKIKNYTQYVSTLSPVANYYGYLPVVSTFTGLIRIVNSIAMLAKKVFYFVTRKSQKELDSGWNAFRNLFRGIVELVPVLGNASVIIFDVVRNQRNARKVMNSIGENEVAGIVVNGKVVYQTDLSTVKKLSTGTVKDEECSTVLQTYTTNVLSSLVDHGKKNKIKLSTIFEKVFPEVVQKTIKS